jgi:predicted peptidase
MGRLLLLTLCGLAAVQVVAVADASATSSRASMSFGSALDPQTVIARAQKLAETLAAPGSPPWRAKGDQRRIYRMPEVNEDIAYRVCVPTNWDGKSPLPLVMFLHGAGNNESSYLDAREKQMVKLADQHGYLLVSPLGYRAAYGNSLRLPAVFGQPAEAAKMIAARTAERDRANEISEMDVVQVLELVLREYPVDRSAMFLTGHSMGSGGTWYLGAKYSNYWAALAPMSGPFIQESTYAWENIRRMPIFMTEGTGATPSLAGSRLMRDWMKQQGFKLAYKEVEADHAGVVPLVLPEVFAFFDRCRQPAGK